MRVSVVTFADSWCDINKVGAASAPDARRVETALASTWNLVFSNFELAAMEGTKLLVRYTATRNYPQCAVVDSSSKLPAYPFQMVVAP